MNQKMSKTEGKRKKSYKIGQFEIGKSIRISTNRNDQSRKSIQRLRALISLSFTIDKFFKPSGGQPPPGDALVWAAPVAQIASYLIGQCPA